MPGTPHPTPASEEKEYDFQYFYTEAKRVLNEYQTLRAGKTDSATLLRVDLVTKTLQQIEEESKKPVPSRAEIILLLNTALRKNDQITSDQNVGTGKLNSTYLGPLIVDLTDKYKKAVGVQGYKLLQAAEFRRKNLESLMTEREQMKSEDIKRQRAMSSLLAKLGVDAVAKRQSLNIVLDDLLTKKAAGEECNNTVEASLVLDLYQSKTVTEVRGHIRSYIQLIEETPEKPDLYNKLIGFLVTLPSTEKSPAVPTPQNPTGSVFTRHKK